MTIEVTVTHTVHSILIPDVQISLNSIIVLVINLCFNTLPKLMCDRRQEIHTMIFSPKRLTNLSTIPKG